MNSEPKRATQAGFLFSAVVTALIFPAVILFAAGTWRWIEGWLFALWFDTMALSSMIYMYRKDPALLAERSGASGSANQKKWDRYLLTVIYLLAVAWLILMPLDARRFVWSPSFPVWVKVAGGVALLPALYFIYRSTVENTFMSTRVRIQSERKQQVISSGVYGLVRHPLYLGCVLLLLGAPLLLGSLYGMGISLIGVVTLVVRIIGEEKMLLAGLVGYEEYRKKVRYRLIPYVW